jgi:hypothetical protein
LRLEGLKPMQRLALAGVAAATTLSLLTGVAGASTFTLGSTAKPSGSPTVTACGATGVFAQTAGDPSTLYTLPAGGQITQWQTNTVDEAAGTPVDLVALTPEAGVFRVDAVDDETVPSPAGGLATFTPASPMMVSASALSPAVRSLLTSAPPSSPRRTARSRQPCSRATSRREAPRS